MVIILSLLICIVGAIIVYTTVPTPTSRWTEIGRAMLWMGLVAFLLSYHGGNPFVITGNGR